MANCCEELGPQRAHPTNGCAKINAKAQEIYSDLSTHDLRNYTKVCSLVPEFPDRPGCSAGVATLVPRRFGGPFRSKSFSVHLPTYLPTCLCACMRAYVRKYMWAHMHNMCKYAYTYIYMYTQVVATIYIYIYICVYMYYTCTMFIFLLQALAYWRTEGRVEYGRVVRNQKVQQSSSPIAHSPVELLDCWTLGLLDR